LLIFKEDPTNDLSKKSTFGAMVANGWHYTHDQTGPGKKWISARESHLAIQMS